jgi:hypothetical protein
VSAGTHLDQALAAEARAYRLLLAGGDARAALIEARDGYLASHAETGPTSWGRLLGALKMAILAGDGVDAVAERALAETAGADSPASGYVRALAQVATDTPPDVALMVAAGGAFERTARALAALADDDATAYAAALGEIVADFEARPDHLSGVPFADTAVVLERLAAARELAVGPTSPVMPSRYTAADSGL